MASLEPTQPPAKSAPALPIYYRLWERYPSGRRYERVSVHLQDGTERSITRTADESRMVEFALRHALSTDAGDSDRGGEARGAIDSRCTGEGHHAQ